jgi:hypothetical protein
MVLAIHRPLFQGLNKPMTNPPASQSVALMVLDIHRPLFQGLNKPMTNPPASQSAAASRLYVRHGLFSPCFANTHNEKGTAFVQARAVPFLLCYLE